MNKQNLKFAKGFAEHRQSQVSIGLRLTPAERLRWLEETMKTMRRWQGKAQQVEKKKE
ncbi:MAG: hypothetical protein JW841_17435 [Deltaproteobacteria bacterium]|nr:hypothetical protein [Deltaproteobacteria bacterium]